MGLKVALADDIELGLGRRKGACRRLCG